MFVMSPSNSLFTLISRFYHVWAFAQMSIRIWESDGYCSRTIVTESCIYSLAFNPTKPYMTTGSKDCLVRVYDTGASPLLPSEMLSSHYPCNSLIIACRNCRLTSGHTYTESFNCLQTLSGHTGIVSYIAYDREGIRLASVSSDCRIIIWELFFIGKTAASSAMVPPLSVVYGGLLRLCCVRVCTE